MIYFLPGILLELTIIILALHQEYMPKKEKITMKHFVSCIPWEQIEMVLGKRDLKKFYKWMRGQTVPTGGVYEEDLARFLNGLPVID